jgi:hypothetical protein
MGRGLILRCKLACRGLLLPQLLLGAVVLCGISPPFGRLSPARGNITHVLLTRAPLYWGRSPFSCDLHVLGAPLTFVLSQDQTLQLNLSSPRVLWERILRCEPRALAFGIWRVASVKDAPPGWRTARPRALRWTHSSAFARAAERERAKRQSERTIQFSRTEGAHRSKHGAGHHSDSFQARQGRVILPCRGRTDRRKLSTSAEPRTDDSLGPRQVTKRATKRAEGFFVRSSYPQSIRKKRISFEKFN